MKHRIRIERRGDWCSWYCVVCDNCGVWFSDHRSPLLNWWAAFRDSVFYRIHGICHPASTTGSDQP